MTVIQRELWVERAQPSPSTDRSVPHPAYQAVVGTHYYAVEPMRSAATIADVRVRADKPRMAGRTRRPPNPVLLWCSSARHRSASLNKSPCNRPAHGIPARVAQTAEQRTRNA
jgi:hypothetical protein